MKIGIKQRIINPKT